MECTGLGEINVMALLRGMSDPVKGKTFDIEETTLTMGRGPDNQLCLADASVSTHHCVIEREGQKYTLRDLDSTNGTRLNGQMVKTSRLNPKDIIQVGSVNLLFDGEGIEIDPDAQEASVSRKTSGPVTTIETRTPGDTPVSSAFGKKSDNRRIVNAAIFLIAALVAAALVVFIIKLIR